jgi:hypothetical protein
MKLFKKKVCIKIEQKGNFDSCTYTEDNLDVRVRANRNTGKIEQVEVLLPDEAKAMIEEFNKKDCVVGINKGARTMTFRCRNPI